MIQLAILFFEHFFKPFYKLAQFAHLNFQQTNIQNTSRAHTSIILKLSALNRKTIFYRR